MKKIGFSLLFTFFLSVNFYGLEANVNALKKKHIQIERHKIQDADRKAQFPGGEKALKVWLKENLHYPEGAKRYGSVIVTFTVKKNGALTDFKVHKGVNEILDIAAVEILRGMPKWEAAIKNGKKVNSIVQLPVKFVPQND